MNFIAASGGSGLPVVEDQLETPFPDGTADGAAAGAVDGKAGEGGAGGRRGGSLGWRLASALVLGPLALLLAWLGGWTFAAVTALAALQMLTEWHRLTGEGRLVQPSFLVKALLLALALAAAADDFWLTALGLLALSLPLAGSSVLWRRDPAGTADRSFGAAAWAAGGMLYIGLAAIAFLWLRADSVRGLSVVLWLLAVVWATDTGAFVAGRLIGGPKLAPRLSPNKTWAGLIGGIAAAGLVGALAAALSGLAPDPGLVAFSALLSLVAVAGDLTESAVKRHFGVKDAGTLIPGHGGALDRLDSLLFAAPAAALIVLLMGSGG